MLNIIFTVIQNDFYTIILLYELLFELREMSYQRFYLKNIHRQHKFLVQKINLLYLMRFLNIIF